MSRLKRWVLTDGRMHAESFLGWLLGFAIFLILAVGCATTYCATVDYENISRCGAIEEAP